METHNHRSVGDTFLKLPCSIVASWTFAVAAVSVIAHSEGGDGQGLFVKLDIPWTTFMAGETFVFRYTLENASNKPAAVALPIADDGFGWPVGGQPFLEAKWREGRNSEYADYDIKKSTWPPKTNVNEEPQDWGQLPPGRKLTWNQNQIPPEYYGVGCSETLESVQAHWLVGPNRWISSNPVPVKIVNVPKSEWSEEFKISWSSYGYGKDDRSAVVYRIPLEGKMYLFVEGWFRVAKVDPDDEFEHQIDKDGTNLEITIKSAKGSRKVYFHLRHGITQDTPWPIGPVELFAPEPEPIPPAELAALRKAAFPEGFPETGNSRPERKPGSQPSAETAESEKTPRGGFPAWALAAVPALLVGMVVFIFRRMRGAAGRKSRRS